jgi:FlaA1/EpsC-like NDP-sugar epimerase
MICLYLDHETFLGEEEKLASLSLQYKSANYLNPEDGISLITCHRIEYYIFSDIGKAQVTAHTARFTHISDTNTAYRRLFEIALGLRSQIIAENAVIKQVFASVRKYIEHHHDSVCETIIKNAQYIRDTFSFYAPNHGELIYKHLQGTKEGSVLILIGAGLLTQTLIASITLPTKYSRVFVITRDTKRAKKRILEAPIPVSITKITGVREQLWDVRFDILIATDDISELYAAEIQSLCSLETCGTIADVSSVPLAGLSGKQKEYYSLYTENTRALVRECNERMGTKKQEVLEFLKKIDDVTIPLTN